MFSPVDLKQIEWAGSSSNLCSTGTKGALPVDHTLTIKSVRAFKNIKSISVSSIQKQRTFTRGLKPLL